MSTSLMNDPVARSWLLDPIPLEDLDQSSQQAALHLFSDHIWLFYGTEQRHFPWRETDDPYKILLSELMLQQTQTERVLPKYRLFLDTWPDFRAMAQASLADVIAAWRGLGYNRRALALRSIAQRSESFGWTLPNDYDELVKFPMIGPATAAAICAFSYREPAIYLETNIRRVLIHQFHSQEDRVSDVALRRELSALLELQKDYKQWYYALMDYGVYLKRILVNPNRRSAHYTKQAKFTGSNRQLRGLLLLAFTEQGLLPLDALCERIPFPRGRIEQCLQSLIAEGFIHTYMQTAEHPQVRYGIPSH